MICIWKCYGWSIGHPAPCSLLWDARKNRTDGWGYIQDKTNMAEMWLIESRWWLWEHSWCNSFNFSVCLHSFKNRYQRIKCRHLNWMRHHMSGFSKVPALQHVLNQWTVVSYLRAMNSSCALCCWVLPPKFQWGFVQFAWVVSKGFRMLVSNYFSPTCLHSL